MDRPTREFALQLMASKDKMESDLAALMDVLKSVFELKCNSKFVKRLKVSFSFRIILT